MNVALYVLPCPSRPIRVCYASESAFLSLSRPIRAARFESPFPSHPSELSHPTEILLFESAYSSRHIRVAPSEPPLLKVGLYVLPRPIRPLSFPHAHTLTGVHTLSTFSGSRSGSRGGGCAVGACIDPPFPLPLTTPAVYSAHHNHNHEHDSSPHPDRPSPSESPRRCSPSTSESPRPGRPHPSHIS